MEKIFILFCKVGHFVLGEKSSFGGSSPNTDLDENGGDSCDMTRLKASLYDKNIKKLELKVAEEGTH